MIITILEQTTSNKLIIYNNRSATTYLNNLDDDYQNLFINLEPTMI